MQVLSPTHEEAATEILRSLPVTSDRDLPIKLYQIGTKFRDEMRPKFGLIRANEFTMKDLYTFDKDQESAEETYTQVTAAYHNIFTRLGVPWVRVAGEAGAMGGSVSHEYHFPAPIGQDTLLVCDTCGAGTNKELAADLACADTCCSRQVRERRGIEVAHTFLLGDRYSSAMGARYRAQGGGHAHYVMGCYGIGVSRVLAASLEVSSTQTELRWPEAIAPFSVAVLAAKEGSKEAAGGGLLQELCQDLETIFPDDVIVDDRAKLTVGRKLREARKTGYPFIVLFGKKSVGSAPLVELHTLATAEVAELAPGELLEHLARHRAARQPDP